MRRVKFYEEQIFERTVRDGVLGEILEACFWSGLGVAEWSGVGGEGNDVNHFLVWDVGVGD